MVSVPLTVGKKAKGKVVSFDSLVVTYSLTGTAATATDPASASNLGIAITAPNGRDTGVVNPGGGDPNATTIGPVIATPDSPFGTCSTALTAPAPSTTVCDPADVQDPEGTIKPPTYAGVIGDDSLQIFGGVPARGTWTVKVRNFSTVTTGTLSNVSLTMGLIQAPSRK
jgi:hypothetical protein